MFLNLPKSIIHSALSVIPKYQVYTDYHVHDLYIMGLFFFFSFTFGLFTNFQKKIAIKIYTAFYA